MTYPSGQGSFSQVCPYLGLADDADSHATYSTEAHRCYKLPRPTKIALPHQETYCLGENHPGCPVFQGEGIPATRQPDPAMAAAPAAMAPPAPPPVRREPFAPQQPADRPVRQVPVADGGEPRARQQRPRRQPALGSSGRGPITMPMATIGLFAIAIAVIALVFVVLSLTGDDDDGGLSPADAVATNSARQTEQAQTPSGSETPETETAAPGTGTPGGEETEAPTATTAAGGSTYTVVSGDTCGAIATDHGISLQELMDANDITDPDCPLNVGDVLTIPE